MLVKAIVGAQPRVCEDGRGLRGGIIARRPTSCEWDGGLKRWRWDGWGFVTLGSALWLGCKKQERVGDGMSTRGFAWDANGMDGQKR